MASDVELVTEYQKIEQLAIKAGFKSYQDYLRSDHWRELRQRSGVILNPCCVCRSKSRVAHHIRYRNLIDVLPEDLVGICCECHDDFHMACRKSRRSYIDVAPPEIAAITTALRATAWYQRWKLRKQNKRERKIQNSPQPRQLASKQKIKRVVKHFLKSKKNETSIMELAAWLLEHCCNKRLTAWKAEQNSVLLQPGTVTINA